MTYNVFGGTLNPAQSNPERSVIFTRWRQLHSELLHGSLLPQVCSPIGI